MRRRANRIGLALAAAAGLGACTVGPRYAPPTPIAPPSGSFAASTPSTAAEAPPPPDWWRLYNTPAIDRLVQEALTHNKNLLVAAANLTQARAALSLARAARYPSTNALSDAQYGITSGQQLASGLLTTTPKPELFYEGGLDVSYEVDLFGRIHRAVQAAAANYEAYRAAQDVSRISVAGETTRAYVNACAYAQELAVARQSLSVVTQTYQVTVKEAETGSASDFDVARARVLVEQTRATLPTFEGQRRTALFELAVLTGRPPEEISREADACKAPPTLVRVLPVGNVQGLFKRRPDVRQAERQLAANVARIGVATADLYPTVTITGSILDGGAIGGAASAAASGVAGAAGSAAASGLGGGSDLTYAIGPALSWSFPNTLVARAEIREARANASASLSTFQATVLQALQDTEEALTAYGAELNRNASLTTARDQSQIAFNLAQVRFNGGEASYLDVLTAETDLVNAQATLASSGQALASDQVTVFKALGGGWEQAPDIRPAPIVDGRTGRLISVH